MKQRADPLQGQGATGWASDFFESRERTFLNAGPIAVRLWGRRPMKWLFLVSVGRSGGIVTIWDPQTVELLDSKIGSFFL